MKLKKMAGALSFAHLLGLPGAAAAKAEDDDEKDKAAKAAEDDKQRDDESDEDYAKRMEEKDTGEDDDEREDKTKGKSKRADDGDGDGSSDEDDDDEEAKAVRRAERARCAAIVAFGVKNGCVRQAGVFAFDTSLTAAQAIAAITAGSADNKRAGSLASRMEGTLIPNVGTDAGPGAPDLSNPAEAAKATAALIIRAGQKRRNEV